ncbi:rhodanese-like domain-containing protein [Streptomyces durbertensis]|uniref:Rhodanese-like domain-containing protein n=1 Tax=Streptomyces durbertensis TaxID=2448886 RepID=A0ABR6E9D4_9ACTN|nr:rhodanese-like domain-containing protein [Streptomyces durbertensis]MBB1241970.1 rhodanese-like domain-containing protein [Streptomyces durbertensis]
MTTTAEGGLTAAGFFAARLAFQTDVADVHAALSGNGDPGFALVDSRSQEAWRQGRLPGALHLPTAEITARAAALVPLDRPVVTYCWGPGCNGATRAALEFARLGYRVREMLGGVEYWTREGLPVVTDAGTVRRPVDPLTGPAADHCGC